MSTTTSTPATGLKDSDYMQGAAIVTGIIGTSNFVLGEPHGSFITGIALLATTALISLSQYLQAKGH